jgi:hypothetical protein
MKNNVRSQSALPLLTIIIISHYAAGTGHKSAFIPIIITRQQEQAIRLPTRTQQYHSYHPLSIGEHEIRTAGSGHKDVNLTWQTAIRHRIRETASLTMLTINHLIYILYSTACPHHHLFV